MGGEPRLRVPFDRVQVLAEHAHALLNAPDLEALAAAMKESMEAEDAPAGIVGGTACCVRELRLTQAW